MSLDLVVLAVLIKASSGVDVLKLLLVLMCLGERRVLGHWVHILQNGP